jgi:hypothetical protein
MALSQDLKEFLQLFAAHEVEFLLVGAHAVAVHGYPRGTGDIDFWIRRDEDNARRILAALEEFGFGSLGLTVSDLLDENAVIQLGREPHRIDLMTFLTGLDYDDCLPRALQVSYEDVPVRVIGVEDLLRNKRMTGRHKDLADVAEFEKSRR